MQSGFPIVGLFGSCGVFKQRAQFGRQRQAQGNRWIRADANPEAGLFFGGFGYIEQTEHLRRFVFCFLWHWSGRIEREGKSMGARHGVKCR